MPTTTEKSSEKLARLMPYVVDTDIVHSSARLAERKGEKGVYANRERKIGAFLARLEHLEANQQGVRERIWDHFTDGLLTKLDDIPDTYWEQIKQLARDNGHGFRELTFDVKDDQIYWVQESQMLSLAPWRLTLDTPDWPVWFQVYALAGLSGISTFNTEKQSFNRRSKSSTSPYPPCDPDALNAVYRALEERFDGHEIEVSDIEKLVASGNFNKLYSHFLLENKTILSLPEREDEVYGEWREYKRGDEQELAAVAINTPWCIKDPITAKDYLEYGAPYILNDIDEEAGEGTFYIFQLKDPGTEALSDVGVASIRVFNGKVKEISGIEGGPGQFISHVLVNVVQDKVETLPEGKRYLQAFEDNKQLIAMDRKFARGEPFTVEEIKFLYEVDRFREPLDSSCKDIRIEDFKGDNETTMVHVRQLIHAGENEAAARILENEFYELSAVWEAALEGGLPASLVLLRLSQESIAQLIEPLLSHGCSADELLWWVSDEAAVEHYAMFESTVQDKELLREKMKRVLLEKESKGVVGRFVKAVSSVVNRVRL